MVPPLAQRQVRSAGSLSGARHRAQRRQTFQKGGLDENRPAKRNEGVSQLVHRSHLRRHLAKSRPAHSQKQKHVDDSLYALLADEFWGELARGSLLSSV